MALDVNRIAQYYGSQLGPQADGDPFQKLLDALGGGTGLFGLGDAATGGLLGLGTSALGAIGGLLQGPSEAEKRGRKVFNLAQNRLGQNVLQPEQYLADFKRATAEDFNRQAEDINQRLNLDSGVAHGALADNMQSTFAKFLLGAKQQNDVLKNQNDNMLLQLMASLSR